MMTSDLPSADADDLLIAQDHVIVLAGPRVSLYAHTDPDVCWWKME